MYVNKAKAHEFLKRVNSIQPNYMPDNPISMDFTILLGLFCISCFIIFSFWSIDPKLVPIKLSKEYKNSLVIAAENWEKYEEHQEKIRWDKMLQAAREIAWEAERPNREAERIAWEREEAERIEAERIEAERIEAEHREAEFIAWRRAEVARKEAELQERKARALAHIRRERRGIKRLDYFISRDENRLEIAIAKDKELYPNKRSRSWKFAQRRHRLAKYKIQDLIIGRNNVQQRLNTYILEHRYVEESLRRETINNMVYTLENSIQAATYKLNTLREVHDRIKPPSFPIFWSQEMWLDSKEKQRKLEDKMVEVIEVRLRLQKELDEHTNKYAHLFT